VITEGAQAGAMMQLGDEPITIGRANDIEVSLQDDYASGRHARLFPQGSRWFLEDLGSTNGTYVDGQRLSRATVIEPGTEFRVGGTTMQLRG
jgi:FHA domain containing protein